MIRDIIWQHNQKPWTWRWFQLLSNKKTCTKVLEIQKPSWFSLYFPKLLPNPQFRSYKNGMHQKINPSQPKCVTWGVFVSPIQIVQMATFMNSGASILIASEIWTVLKISSIIGIKQGMSVFPILRALSRCDKSIIIKEQKISFACLK